MSDRFHLGLILFVHHTGIVEARGEIQQRKAVNAKPLLHEGEGGIRDVPDGVDAVFLKFPAGCPADVDHVGRRQRPDLFPEVVLRDHRDGVRFLHVTAQLGEDFIERHPDAHSKANFFFHCLPDLLRNLLTISHARAACDIQPALVHAEWLNLVGVAVVNCADELGHFQVLFILRRHHDQPRALLPGFPVDHPGLDAGFLGQFRLCQNNAVAFLGAAAHRDGFPAEVWIQHELHAGVERVQVAVQNCPRHFSPTFSPKLHILVLTSVSIADTLNSNFTSRKRNSIRDAKQCQEGKCIM